MIKMTMTTTKTNKTKKLRDKLQKYEVFDLPMNFDAVLGSGSFSTVYSYEMRQRQVAVKLFNIGCLDRTILSIASQLITIGNHENIVKFYRYS